MKNWYFPEKLSETEKIFYDNEVEINPENDFGSYKLINQKNSLNAKGSKIESHNDLNPKGKIKIIKRFIFNTVKVKPLTNLLNVGCGVGIESLSIHQIFKTNTLGIDISRDAINFAEKNYSKPGLLFSCQMINEETILKNKYDIIFAIEFYPFTRSDNIVFQKGILNSLLNNLSNNGIIVIYQKYNNESSISNTYKQLSTQLDCDYFLSNIVDRRLSRFLPLNYFSGILIKCSKQMISAIFKKEYNETRILIFKKKNK